MEDKNYPKAMEGRHSRYSLTVAFGCLGTSCSQLSLCYKCSFKTAFSFPLWVSQGFVYLFVPRIHVSISMFYFFSTLILGANILHLARNQNQGGIIFKYKKFLRTICIHSTSFQHYNLYTEKFEILNYDMRFTLIKIV